MLTPVHAQVQTTLIHMLHFFRHICYTLFYPVVERASVCFFPWCSSLGLLHISSSHCLCFLYTVRIKTRLLFKIITTGLSETAPPCVFSSPLWTFKTPVVWTTGVASSHAIKTWFELLQSWFGQQNTGQHTGESLDLRRSLLASTR